MFVVCVIIIFLLVREVGELREAVERLTRERAAFEDSK